MRKRVLCENWERINIQCLKTSLKVSVYIISMEIFWRFSNKVMMQYFNEFENQELIEFKALTFFIKILKGIILDIAVNTWSQINH